MSQTPEKIVMNYDSKSKQSKNVALEMKKIVERYRGKRVTKENVCVLVSTLMLQAQNLKTQGIPTYVLHISGCNVTLSTPLGHKFAPAMRSMNACEALIQHDASVSMLEHTRRSSDIMKNNDFVIEARHTWMIVDGLGVTIHHVRQQETS